MKSELEVNGDTDDPDAVVESLGLPFVKYDQAKKTFGLSDASPIAI